MDESRIVRVEQHEDDGMLTLQFQFQLEGMGKPDKFRITAIGFTAVDDTVQEMKVKLCKVAKKLQKRMRRKQQKMLTGGTAGKREGGEENDSQDVTANPAPASAGILSTIAGKILRTFSWQKSDTDNNTAKADDDVSEETLSLIDIRLQHQNGTVVDFDEETKSAFREGTTVTISICDEAYDYDVHCNLPAARILELPRNISDGFLLYPRTVVDFCEADSCRYDWFRLKTRPMKNTRLSVINGKICSGNKCIDIGSKAGSANIVCNESNPADLSQCETSRENGGNISSSGISAEVLEADFVNSEPTPGLSPAADPSDITLSIGSGEDKQEQDTKNATPKESALHGKQKTGNKKKNQDVWEWVHCGLEYTPTAEDIGCYLGVVCTPKSGHRVGCPMVAEAPNPVWQRPQEIPFEKRHAHTVDPADGDSFRIMTYNVLSERYSDTCESRDFRYSYCPPFALTYDYRKQLILAEILGYKPDIVCLQEVDCKAFENDLLSVLGRRGYAGAMATKYIQVSQGVATFYNAEKFTLIYKGSINTANALATEPEHNELLTKVSENPSFRAKALQCGAVLHTTILRHATTGKIVVVANTHLKCGKEQAHLRLVQVLVSLRHVRTLMENYPGASVVMCGDLNSMEYSGVVHLLSNGEIPANHADWFVGGRLDYISGMDFKLPLAATELQSAYTDVAYTNFASGFVGILDYIFYDRDSLTCVKTVPLPSHREVTELTALPNRKFPSDHMALVCDLRWN